MRRCGSWIQRLESEKIWLSKIRKPATWRTSIGSKCFIRWRCSETSATKIDPKSSPETVPTTPKSPLNTTLSPPKSTDPTKSEQKSSKNAAAPPDPPKQTPNTSNPPASPESITPASKENHSKGEDAKASYEKIGRKPPAFILWWYLLGFTSFVVAGSYYLRESDTSQRKIEKALTLLISADDETKLKGFKSLEDCLYLQKRLFSAVSEIPLSKTVFLQAGSVEVLSDCLRSNNVTVQYNSLIWLKRLCEDPEGRKKIALNALDGIHSVLEKASAGSPIWIIATSILLELSSTRDSAQLILSMPKATLAIQTIKKLACNDHPLSILMYAKLVSNLSHIDPSLPIPLEGKPISQLTGPIEDASIEAAVNYVIPAEPLPMNPALGNTFAHVSWALGFAAIGSVWGRARWLLSGRLSGLSGSSLTKFVKERNRVGRYVFLLLAMDLLSEAFMAWPTEGLDMSFFGFGQSVKLPQNVLTLPISTAIPIGEAGLFVCTAMFGIRRQRYIVLPIAMASVSAHWETIHNWSEPYLKRFGLIQINVPGIKDIIEVSKIFNEYLMIFRRRRQEQPKEQEQKEELKQEGKQQQ